MQFGSTQKEEELPEEVKLAKKVRDATATIEGCSAELQIQAQRIANIYERLQTLENLTATLLEEQRQLKKMYGESLNKILGGGPTA